MDVVDVRPDIVAGCDHRALRVLHGPGLPGVLDGDVTHLGRLQEIVDVEPGEPVVEQRESRKTEIHDQNLVMVPTEPYDLLEPTPAVFEHTEAGRVVGIDEEESLGADLAGKRCVDLVRVVECSLVHGKERNAGICEEIVEIVEARFHQGDRHAPLFEEQRCHERRDRCRVGQ